MDFYEHLKEIRKGIGNKMELGYFQENILLCVYIYIPRIRVISTRILKEIAPLEAHERDNRRIQGICLPLEAWNKTRKL